MDKILEKFVGRPMSGFRARHAGATPAGSWSPPLEIMQRDDQLVVSAELPGVKREDVRVEIRTDRLIIEGDRHEETQSQHQGYRRTERSYGHFYRAIWLPQSVDADAASASMRDGVLEITLPVPRNGQGKRLDIRVPE
jgi:HSP20 family molecular chaperone IbpA